MSLFSLDNNQDFMFGSNSNSVECSKCSEQTQKHIRCSCCNEVITLGDIIKHINKTSEVIKLVRLGDKLCIKIHVRDIYIVSKYFRNSDTHTLAVNFEYKVNYIESKTNNGQIIKSVRNIEYVKMLDNFKEDTIEIKHLLMNTGIDYKAEVLLNVNTLNVVLPN
jgi:hypothetical protein